MSDDLLLKYNLFADQGINLSSIGESFEGFDSLIKEILDTASLNDTVEFKVSRISHGSIEVYNTVITLAPVVFNHTEQFLEFLKIAAPEMINDANTFFSNIHDGHRSVNDYFARNPVDFEVSKTVITLIVGYVIGCIRTSAKLKQTNKPPIDSKASPKQINRLKKLIHQGRYKRALSPISDGAVQSINFSGSNDSSYTVRFNENNISAYLPDDAKILPDLHNGDMVSFSGELLSLQSTKGDFMKIKIENIEPKYALLTCSPADGIDIGDFKDMFKQRVNIDAEVLRRSEYKRPELIIKSMSPANLPLDLGEA